MLKTVAARELSVSHTLWPQGAQAPSRIMSLLRSNGVMHVTLDNGHIATYALDAIVYVTNDLPASEITTAHSILVGEQYEAVKWIRYDPKAIVFKTVSGVHSYLPFQRVELC